MEIEERIKAASALSQVKMSMELRHVHRHICLSVSLVFSVPSEEQLPAKLGVAVRGGHVHNCTRWNRCSCYESRSA